MMMVVFATHRSCFSVATRMHCLAVTARVMRALEHCSAGQGRELERNQEKIHRDRFKSTHGPSIEYTSNPVQ